MDDEGEASLDELVDLTEFIAGGLGAALFFKAALGGVELLEDSDPEAPVADWLELEVVVLETGAAALGF